MDAARDGDGGGARLVFAYYITGHGDGHATRALEVVRHLVAAGHDVHVVTAAPDFVFTTEISSPRLHIREVHLDYGAVQPDAALTVDRLASLEKYRQTAVVPRESILKAEAEWLSSIKADLVVADAGPVACRAAADAGIRSICVTNFSWDFVFADFVAAAGYRSVVWQIAEDYSHCEFLLRLPGYCPMPAFRDVIDVPLVVRRLRKSRTTVRKELGIPENIKLVIFSSGGQPAGLELKKEWLPEGWLCLICGVPDSLEVPPNFIKLAKHAYTPDLMAASDCMLGKIGYGIFSEALAYKRPFVFVGRESFNEEPFLQNILKHYECGIEMMTNDLITGHWKDYLQRAIELVPCYDGPINGGEVAAQILQDTAIGKKCISGKLSGARRLCDAIVLGCQLQRAPGRDVGVPHWYSFSEKEISVRPTRTSNDMNGSAESSFKDFDILHGGDMQGLDTMPPLKSLSGLVGNGLRSPEKQTRERAAACLPFDFQLVRAQDRTPSPRPHSKRCRGRSLPPASPPTDGADQASPGAHQRSSSSPPSPDRTRSEDKIVDTAEPFINPMAVFWDLENCCVPKDAKVEDVYTNIRVALSQNFAISDSLTVKAYGYLGAFPNRIKEGLQTTGVTLVNVPNTRKDAADKVMLVDMLMFAHENRTPASMMLISGDMDFALAVHKLVTRGYTVVIATPSIANASSALTEAASYVWDWPSLARGKGIVIPGSLDHCGDLEALKFQMVQLFQLNGGFIPLDRIYPEYKKLHGKHRILASYGHRKLADLFTKLGNPFVVMSEQMVCLETQSALEENTRGSYQHLAEDQASTMTVDVLPSLVIGEGTYVRTECPHLPEDGGKVIEMETLIDGANSLKPGLISSPEHGHVDVDSGALVPSTLAQVVPVASDDPSLPRKRRQRRRQRSSIDR